MPNAETAGILGMAFNGESDVIRSEAGASQGSEGCLQSAVAALTRAPGVPAVTTLPTGHAAPAEEKGQRKREPERGSAGITDLKTGPLLGRL